MRLAVGHRWDLKDVIDRRHEEVAIKTEKSVWLSIRGEGRIFRDDVVRRSLMKEDSVIALLAKEV